jgi:two-component system, cell cycle sensor histidine kinase and response regulator CckA
MMSAAILALDVGEPQIMSLPPIASSPPRARRLAAIRDPMDWLGPAITIASLIAVVLARPIIPISSASIPLLVAVAGAAALGGIGPGLVSAAITIVFVLVDASPPDHLFSYDAKEVGWLALSVVSAIVIAVIVGDIRRRLEGERERLAGQQASRHERALTETAADAMFTIDADGTIRSANPAAGSIFGYSVDELIGRPSTDLLATSLRETANHAREQYLESGTQTMRWSVFETIGRHADGSEFPVEGSFGQYMDDDELLFTSIIRDVSERKALENQLLQAQKMEAVGQLAGGVAHDFNNMLTAIGGFAELIAEDRDDAADRSYAVEAIRAATERAAGLTRQLLAFSRRQRLEPTIVSLNDTIRRIEPLLRRLLGEQVELVVHLADGPWLVLADPSQLETVVVNLAINGRDAMPDGGTLTIKTANLDLDATGARQSPTIPAGPYAIVSVSDTGTGIDPATLSHIFEPFFTTKDFGGGTGLGLSSAHGVIEQSGGRILVDSEAGRGTTFRVYLPRATGAVVERTAAPVALRAPGTGTILVAEDEPVVRDLILTTLRRAGYTVLTAADGRRAMELIDADGDGIDLLVSDVVMPHIGGLELADLVRVRRPGLPIILISGYSEDLLSADRGREGVTVLAKPFTAQRLTELVGDTLARARGALP